MNNVAVITTKYVIENESPIVLVFKDIEGDWQFFGKEENIGEEDGRVVSLSEILDIDPSIEDILWIDNGTQAWREGYDKEWKYSKY